MRNATRLAFNAYLAQIASLHSVPDATKTFAADPSVSQTLETKIQESSEFLGRINMVPVGEQEGERLGLGVSGLIASRTDTSGAGRRATRDPSSLDAAGYRCEKTNFDTHISYAKLDM